MSLKAGDKVIVIPGKETADSQYDVLPGIYTVSGILSGMSMRLQEVKISPDKWKHPDPYYWVSRFKKVDPKTLSRLERIIYGIE